ncbi:hypothetical protein M3Y97_00332600 [Aphelenchoides bicaudatus]|nr:hypothetical protein M3Y97_00332600 [Aphelenchoides bicaudatus]
MSAKRAAKKLGHRAQTLDSSHDILMINYPSCSSTTTTDSSATSSSSNMINLPCEKVFNDAFLTGNLNLCSRQLKEFPLHYAQSHDISDLVNADLSNNCMCILPACICELHSLETLKFASNGLRSIPASISSLYSLTFLDLSNNQLSQLPSSLFTLPLEVLLLAGNRLETLSSDVKQLGETLQGIGFKGKSLETVTSSYRFVDRIACFEFAFQSAKRLARSSNLLIQLPIELHNLGNTCLEFNSDGNPLMKPPISIVQRGSAHVFKWLSMRAEQLGLKQNNSYSSVEQKLRSVEPQHSLRSIENSVFSNSETSDSSSCLSEQKSEKENSKPNRNSCTSIDPVDPFDKDADYRRHINDAQQLQQQICSTKYTNLQWKPTKDAGFLRLSMHYDQERWLCLSLWQNNQLLFEFSSTQLLICLFLLVVLPYGFGEFLRSGRLFNFFLAYPQGLLSLVTCFVDGLFWILDLARNAEPQRRPERRSRSIKTTCTTDTLTTNGTFSGTDSGYITSEEKHETTNLLNRLNGNIEYIDEQTTTYSTYNNESNKTIKGGELAREILMTFDQQSKLANNNNHINLPPRHSNTVTNNNYVIQKQEEVDARPLKFATSSARLSATIQVASKPQLQTTCLSPVVETNELAKLNGSVNARDLKLDKMNASSASIESTASSQVTVLNGQTKQKDQSVNITTETQPIQNGTPKLSRRDSTKATNGSKQPEADHQKTLKLNGETTTKMTLDSSKTILTNEKKTTKTLTDSKVLNKSNGQLKTLTKTAPKTSSKTPVDTKATTKSSPAPARSTKIVPSKLVGGQSATLQRKPSMTKEQLAQKKVAISSTNLSGTKGRAQSSLSLANGNSNDLKVRPLTSATNRLAMTKSMSSKVQPTANKEQAKIQTHTSAKSPQNGSIMSKSVSAKPPVNVGHQLARLSIPFKNTCPTHLTGKKLEQTETGLAQQLADGVLLCAFLNSVRANSIHNVMKPASAHVNLSVTRARRNVESFVAACREIGVPEDSICHSTDILERKNFPATARTINYLAQKFKT